MKNWFMDTRVAKSSDGRFRLLCIPRCSMATTPAEIWAEVAGDLPAYGEWLEDMEACQELVDQLNAEELEKEREERWREKIETHEEDWLRGCFALPKMATVTTGPQISLMDELEGIL